MTMIFQEWFKTQFGSLPSTGDVESVQHEIEELQLKVKRLKEKRSKLIELHNLYRSAFYAWQVKDNQKNVDNLLNNSSTQQ